MAMKFYYPYRYGFYSRDNYSHITDKKLNEALADIELLNEKGKSIEEIIEAIRESYNEYFIQGIWKIEKNGNFIIIESNMTGDKVKIDCKTEEDMCKMEEELQEFLGDREIYEVLHRESKKSDYVRENLTREEILEEVENIELEVYEITDWGLDDRITWEGNDKEFRIILNIKQYEKYNVGYKELVIRKN